MYLSDQPRKDCYTCMMLYMNTSHVTTKPKLIHKTNTQKKVRNESKYNTKEYHKGKEKEKNEKTENKNSKKTINKITISTFLWIIKCQCITLSNQKTYSDWMDNKTRLIYVLPAREWLFSFFLF